MKLRNLLEQNLKMSQMQKFTVGPKMKAGRTRVMSGSLAYRFKLGNQRIFQMLGLVWDRERKCQKKKR